MKKVLFIGNRYAVLEALLRTKNLSVVAIYVLKESHLDKKIAEMTIPSNIKVHYFGMGDKQKLFQEITDLDFDILLSNGCPFILPVSKMKKSGQLFINIHPTVLPHLKGRTPLSGVFLTHVPYIGATMHYIDDGIDTGPTIYQAKVTVTDDLDQGLVYKISFDLEAAAFKEGIKLLAQNDFVFAGEPQHEKGSYFNRTEKLQTLELTDSTDTIFDKVRSFGVKGQGSYLNIKDGRFIVYAAEKITNQYLLDAYKKAKPGEVLFYYDDKFLLRTKDGIIKIVDYQKG